VAPPGAEEGFRLTVPMGPPRATSMRMRAAFSSASELSSYVTGQTIHVRTGGGGPRPRAVWYHHPGTAPTITRAVLKPDRASGGPDGDQSFVRPSGNS